MSIIPSAAPNNTNPAGSELTAHAAEIRLAQYSESAGLRVATYGNGTEKALHQIALALLAELDRLRAELAALPAPVMETAFRDGLGNVWPVGHFPAATEALVLKSTPTLQRTVRISEWTEVAS
ncbi:hypothetical protein [Streptomyces sp. NPDC002215]|uniref:hypothetical protein n=1 Tax=Streptomyces sp. NPDC002215 TaxID=3154412 RepID=UPI00331E4675